LGHQDQGEEAPVPPAVGRCRFKESALPNLVKIYLAVITSYGQNQIKIQDYCPLYSVKLNCSFGTEICPKFEDDNVCIQKVFGQNRYIH
jgi:hypothetical protein